MISSTMISPWPDVPVHVVPVQLADDPVVLMVTLPLLSALVRTRVSTLIVCGFSGYSGSFQILGLPIVISSGSSSQFPAAPCGAAVLTEALALISKALPDVSTWPPLPAVLPPRAVMLPSNCVILSDHTATLPPLPVLMASALIAAPAWTVVVCACCSGPAPRKLPPISAVPPPPAPDTSIKLPAASVTAPPSTFTVPPVVPPATPAASSVPLLVAVPALPAPSTMVPPTCSTLRALIIPVLLTTLASTASLAPADSHTAPPSALIRPPFSARLFSVL